MNRLVGIRNNLIICTKHLLIPPQLELNKETGIYCLTMELPCAIDFVLFQSTTSIELIDTEKNQAVVSVCDCDPLVICSIRLSTT